MARLLAERKCYTKQEVAAMAGISRTTLWRWLQHKEYRRYCDRIYDQVLDEFTNDIMEELKQKDREYKKRLRAMERKLENEKFAAEYKKLDNWLRKNHCPDNERKQALKVFEEQYKNMKHKRS